MQQLRPSRPLWALLVALGLLAAAAAAFSATRTSAPTATRLAGRGGCARGYVRERETGTALHRARGAVVRRDRGECVRLGHPEGGELLQVNQQRAARTTAPFSSVKAGAGRAAVRDANALRANQASVPGAQGEWTPLGKGAMDASDPNYDQSQGSTSEGFHGVTGRVEDFTYNPASGRLYAAPVNGGVWQSDDRGGSWRSIGDNLPTQVVGSVAWSSANGGEVLALTGDPAFGFESTAGMGVYRSNDDGKTWQRGVGLPDGALGFQLAVDPTNPEIIYAATSAGLYRTTDAGANWADVGLPTGACAGHTFDTPGCFLANIVTDVVVQGPANGATGGGKPGAVMAAVGWRAGTRPNLQTPAKPESPQNGIYTSDTGASGTFQFVTAPARKSGFAGDSQDVPGRIALGIANGPQQDHRVVYAMVQDAEKFNGNEGDDPIDQVPTGVFSQIFNGVWTTTDFGQNWTRMESATALDNDQTSNSALEPSGKALSYEPGVQSWYNEWISPDPTQQDADGVPTRVAFGLEEIWASRPGNPQPTPFHVVGRYWNACQFGLVNGVPRCDADPQQSPTTSGSTTHPDQHAGLWIPDADGKGVTLFAGSDGGVFSQHVANGEDLANDKWSNNPSNKGPGAQGTGDLALHTLQPYDVEMAKDGTAYMGLQDNGEGKIFPDGTQKAVYGGDGFFTAVDPDNANTAWEEYAGGVMAATDDGGKTWKDEDPGLISPQFSTPFKMDPSNAKHLLTSGRDVEETTAGTATVECFDPSCSTIQSHWNKVYDLGTMKHPGDANAPDSTDPVQGDPTDPNNSASAVELQGANAYIGFCGFCDVITEDAPFHSGLATNVGGSQPPKPNTAQGWHIAQAAGLPNRFITSIATDPAHPEIVYVGLAGYGRHWAPPGARGEALQNVGTGHVFRSVDAGGHFTDVTGDLPDTPVDSLALRGNQIVVGTDVGAFISSDAQGSAWAPMGTAPRLPYVHLQTKPGDPNTLVVATYGRGAYTYRYLPTATTTSSGNTAAKPASTATPVACAAAAGFRTASVSRRRKGLHFNVARRAKPLASVDVFQVSNGRKVITERLIARFRNVRGSFNWNGKANRHGRKVRDGYLFARFSERFGTNRVDVRRVTLRRVHGRYTLRKSFYRRASCGLLSSYKLIRPVFGGPRNHRLSIAYRVSRRARVTVTVLRGKKVLRRFKATTASARRTYRLVFSAKHQRRGDYSVKLTAIAGKQKVTSTLVSRRL